MTTKTKALKLLQESRAQLAYLGDDKHTNELVSQIDAVLAQPEQETCKGCNGNGMVGNILDTVVCPFCKGSGVEAQPEQRSVSEHLKELRSDEPVAWMKEGWGPDCGPYIEFYRDDEMGWRDRKEWTPLYTTPPQPQNEVRGNLSRKPLTDEQILHFVDTHVGVPSMAYPLDNSDWMNFARAIEAAHNIKE